jgi:hypothetical protein
VAIGTDYTGSCKFNYHAITATTVLTDNYATFTIPFSCPLFGLITGFLTQITRRVSLVEQDLITLPDRMGIALSSEILLVQ